MHKNPVHRASWHTVTALSLAFPLSPSVFSCMWVCVRSYIVGQWTHLDNTYSFPTVNCFVRFRWRRWCCRRCHRFCRSRNDWDYFCHTHASLLGRIYWLCCCCCCCCSVLVESTHETFFCSSSFSYFAFIFILEWFGLCGCDLGASYSLGHLCAILCS